MWIVLWDTVRNCESKDRTKHTFFRVGLDAWLPHILARTSETCQRNDCLRSACIRTDIWLCLWHMRHQRNNSLNTRHTLNIFAQPFASDVNSGHVLSCLVMPFWRISVIKKTSLSWERWHTNWWRLMSSPRPTFFWASDSHETAMPGMALDPQHCLPPGIQRVVPTLQFMGAKIAGRKVNVSMVTGPMFFLSVFMCLTSIVQPLRALRLALLDPWHLWVSGTPADCVESGQCLGIDSALVNSGLALMARTCYEIEAAVAKTEWIGIDNWFGLSLLSFI